MTKVQQGPTPCVCFRGICFNDGVDCMYVDCMFKISCFVFNKFSISRRESVDTYLFLYSCNIG